MLNYLNIIDPSVIDYDLNIVSDYIQDKELSDYINDNKTDQIYNYLQSKQELDDKEEFLLTFYTTLSQDRNFITEFFFKSFPISNKSISKIMSDQDIYAKYLLCLILVSFSKDSFNKKMLSLNDIAYLALEGKLKVNNLVNQIIIQLLSEIYYIEPILYKKVMLLNKIIRINTVVQLIVKNRALYSCFNKDITKQKFLSKMYENNKQKILEYSDCLQIIENYKKLHN